MSKKLGIIACLCSLQLYAETDSFNMSLAGDFSKDYCTITTTSNGVDVSFDVNEREMAYAEGGYEGEMAYHFLNAMVITVNCSPGAYNLAVSNTEVRSRVYIGGDGSVMAQNIHVFANGASDFEPEVDSGSPASVSNVNPLGDGKLADVHIDLQVVPGHDYANGINYSESLPDEINHTFQNIITIERL